MNQHSAVGRAGAANDQERASRAATVAIIGGGPAGLTAAYQLQKNSESHHPVVFEESHQVGGISRTEMYKGYRYDIGGHRFFTKVSEVESFWHEILPEGDFLMRPRMSRIYYNNKFFDYPLKAGNALGNLGIIEALRTSRTSRAGSPPASGGASTGSSSRPTPRRSGACRRPRSRPTGRPSGSRTCRSSRP